MKKLYFLVNKDIPMSSAKISTQVSHCTVEFTLKNQHTEDFKKWYNDGKTQTKVILGVNQKTLEKFENEYISIRDNGLTEIQAGTLTCVCLGLLEQDDVLVRRFQTLKSKDISLTTNKETFTIIAEALELVSRIKLGQLDKISDLFANRKFDGCVFKEYVSKLKSLVFKELNINSYNGIYSDETPYDSKILYDVYKSIMHEINKDNLNYNVHSMPHILKATNVDIDVKSGSIL